MQIKDTTRYDIARDIKQECGSALVNLSQISRYTGMCRDNVRKMLKDVPYYCLGKAKLFTALDVAKALEQYRSIYGYGDSSF